MKRILLLAFSFGMIWIFSCRKSLSEFPDPSVNDSTSVNSKPPAPLPPAQPCTAGPNYGDSIVYQQPTMANLDYLVSPINNPGPGQYISWPQGLSIDNSTGVIDITKSETGQRYIIGFIASGSTDTCLHPLIIGGSSYPDSIYVLAASHAFAGPYFDANPNTPSPCAGGGCHFQSMVKLSGKDVNIQDNTGIIDVQASFNGGIFGPTPVDGETQTATIQYSLNGQSNKAIQTMQVEFIYYGKKSSIPAALLNLIASKRAQMLTDSLISVNANPKPPLLIITRVAN
jgi:hypothetical protein